MSLDFLLHVRSFRDLVSSLERKEPRLTVAGLAEAARPYVLACLASSLKGRLLCILPSSVALDETADRCRYFLAHLAPSKRISVLPGPGIPAGDDAPLSLEAAAGRLKFYHDLLHHPPHLVLTDLFGLLRPCPPAEELPSLFCDLEPGARIDRESVLRMLDRYGYAPEELIASRGEYARRGGIVDVFSPWEDVPFRLEFAGETLASLRTFDPSSQRTLRKLNRAVIPSLREFLGDGQRPFVSYRAHVGDSIVLVLDFEEVEREWEESRRDLGEEVRASVALDPDEEWTSLKESAVLGREWTPSEGDRVHRLNLQPLPRLVNNIPFFLQYLKKLQAEGHRCYLFLSGEPMRQRFRTLLEQEGIPSAETDNPMETPRRGEILLIRGRLEQGFGHPEEKIFFFSENDVVTAEKVISGRRAARPLRTDFQDLRAGDTVVHADYGIGRFQGLFKMEVEGQPREFIELVYRDGDKLFVPVEDLNLVQKYAAPDEEAQPVLDKLGTNAWQKTKQRAKRAVTLLARELLELYARRKAAKGHAFSSGGDWLSDFEKMFPYEETEDQLRSIREIYADMESPQPMDRLLCGDVGYGKTEVAMRAAFKAVMNGKQVAVLCPTTVLASQHFQTFRNRMLLFPVRIEALTRLQSRTEQARVLEELRAGAVDILIGTHRLLSKDVVFRDLGLLIVDEEQRFGVTHKEKIKQLKTDIDVLTMTATPIPRTLNMSLSGLRDISLIETPPRDRLAVGTVVTVFSPRLVASAVRQELKRGGQVYWIHNRIEDIDQTAALLVRLVPEARVSIIHGRMAPRLLERRMLDFIERKTNVLVSTTIIENGIDIPLVNTLIVDRADLYGLAQLYQLRGRVGRSSRQATAYFLVPPYAELKHLARRRLRALKDFSELGSGFRLAAKDLEIRGAGNLLGQEQHGLMAALGYDYFLHLLGQAVRELKGEAVEEIKTEINLKIDIRLPEDYIPQVNLRLQFYKRISSIESLDEIPRLESEMIDRFGPLPPGARRLLAYGAVKWLAGRLRLKSLDRFQNRLTLKFSALSSWETGGLIPLMKTHSGRWVSEGILSFTLSSSDDRRVLDETFLILKELENRVRINRSEI